VERLIGEIVRHLGRLDILIHAASVAFHGKTVDDPSLNHHAMDLQWQVNVSGYIAAVRAATLHMKEGGRIIAIGSGLAVRVSMPGVADYAATKAAVLGYTRGAALDLASRGITANVILAGTLEFETPIARRQGLQNKHTQSHMLSCSLEEIAAAVVFLSSPRAASITGTALDLTGGYLS
jgi:NAD(P)-dependent dehydrogenase (short-subunit alcohol dehydrogenase family)